MIIANETALMKICENLFRNIHMCVCVCVDPP